MSVCRRGKKMIGGAVGEGGRVFAKKKRGRRLLRGVGGGEVEDGVFEEDDWQGG